MQYITDYHIHTTYSDGKAPPEDYIGQAIEKGISEIGFSEHLALFKEDQDWVMNPLNVDAYLKKLDYLKDLNERIIIRKGLEVDYIEGREHETAVFLDGLDLDYRIGSVHYLGEKTVDEGPEFYTGRSFDRLFESYFEMVGNAVESGLFDIIGHPDLIRIFGYKPSFDPAPFYRRLAKKMKKNDVAFEINTNGRNRPMADFYPDRRFLHFFSEEKVPVCVNSDAHMPSRVGQYFDEAFRLIRNSGFTGVVAFRRRERRFIPI